MNTFELRSQITAAFALIAMGDALGMPAEIMTPEEIAKTFGRITTYVDPPKDHKWHSALSAGRWTDDWQLTMAVAQSLISKKSINLDDIAERHVKALHESVSGWGGSTTQAVKNIESGTHWSKSGIPDAAGNGIAMKIAPLGALLAIKYLRLHEEFPGEKAEEKFFAYQGDFNGCVVEISRMTHQSRMAIASGLAQAYAMLACITFPEKDFAENFLTMVLRACRPGEILRFRDNVKDKLSDKIIELRDTRDYERLSLDELIAKYGGTGKARFYVLNSLLLSYAIFLRNPNSIETLFDAVNAGGDTDTNASMVGALLGARNGMRILEGHEHLIKGLWRKEEVIATAEQFCDTFISRED